MAVIIKSFIERKVKSLKRRERLRKIQLTTLDVFCAMLTIVINVCTFLQMTDVNFYLSSFNSVTALLRMIVALIPTKEGSVKDLEYLLHNIEQKTKKEVIEAYLDITGQLLPIPIATPDDALVHEAHRLRDID